MPDKTYGEEVIVAIVLGIIVFLVIITLMTFIIIFYQKKRFLHHQQLAEKDKEYSEQLLQSQIEIQEQTFNTISLEIHDNVGQTLSLAKVQLNILDQKQVLDKELLAETKESVGKAMTDLRDIAKSLNSDRIRQTNLYEITMHELQRFNRSGVIKASAKFEGNAINLKEQTKLIVFRIIQESLQNVIKHSNATIVEVSFRYEMDHLEIAVADNGRGFNSLSEVRKDGLGLQNILNRAKLIGGSATIESTPGTGTIITIILPYE